MSEGKEKRKIPKIRFPGFTDDWKQRKVSGMFKVTRGYVLPATVTTATPDDVNCYPVFSSQTANNGLMGYYKDYLYEDAVTWTTDGANAGTVRYRAGKFYCTNVCGVLLSDKVRASKMVAEALNLVAKKYVSYVGNPKLMNNVMADISIYLPSNQKEQEAISEFFENLDNLITLHQRKLDDLKELKKGLLQSLFPKDGKTIPEIRFPGFNDDWEQRKLKSIVISHNAGVYINKNDYGEGINIIGVGNIYDSDAIDGQVYRLAPVKDKQYILDEGDIIYGESSLVPEGIARTMYVTKNGAGTAFAWHTRRVKLNQDVCNAHFATLELNYNQQVRRYLMSVSTQTALTGMTTEGYFGTTLYLPSLEEQKEISAFFTNLDNLITLHQRKLDDLKELKKGLLQQMFI